MSSGQANAEVGVDGLAATLTTLHEAPIAAYVVNALTANGVGTCGADDNQTQAGHLLPMAFDTAQITSAANGTRVSPELPASTLAKGSRMHVAYPVQEVGKRTGTSTTDPRAGIGVGQSDDPMFTLQAGAQHGVATFNDDGTARTLTARCGSSSPCADRGPDVVAYGFDWQSGGDCRGLDLKPTVQLQAHQTPASLSAMRVRRLTPTECERLQGFPDGWTQVPYRGKPASDGPRYKAIGNSMAVPVMAWIGRRIAEVNTIISLKEAA